MAKRKYRTYNYYRKNDDTSLGYLFLFGIIVLISFINRYKLYIIIILTLIALFLLVLYIYNLDLKGKLKKPNLYYEGQKQKKRFDEVERQKGANDYFVNCLRKGIKGEESILYTLKQSNIPMYILYDLNLEINGLKAQIDIVIITKKGIYLLESKNLRGDYIIDDFGNVIRQIGKKKKGMKNPITQLKEHEVVIEEIFKEEKIRNKYTSLVILTNDNNLIDYNRFNEEYSEVVIRNDQLVRKIKQFDSKKHINFTEKKIINICNALLKYNSEFIDYETIENDDFIRKELVRYRTQVKLKDNIPYDYYIYKDEAIDDLINKKPKSLNELKEVYGFGENNIAKYGEDILNIINKSNKI